MRLVIFGASGRTGIHLVRQALEAGHQVTAFVRDPARLPVQHDRLRTVRGDVRDAAAVAGAIAGQDGVVSALGPTRTSQPDVLTLAARHILAGMVQHGVRRYVGLTGAGVSAPGDPPSIGRTVMLTLLKLLARKVLEDSERSVRLIQESDRDWTIVRAPVLTDGPLRGSYRTGTLTMGPGARIARADVAHFMLRLLDDPHSHRTMPMICY